LIGRIEVLLTFCFLQVVYAVLHRQEVFEPFKNHPRFNELLENIYTVCVTVYVS
jgi:hypothetical protein